MFFAITNIILDISLGIIWWTTKNTSNLVYFGVRKLLDNTPSLMICDKDDETMYFIISEDEYKKLNSK